MSEESGDASFAGRLIVITAPSGSGKTTIVRHLLKNYPQVEFSISATTRQRREHEVHGRDYYFVDPNEFNQLIENDKFAEWEEVYENQFYGTLHSEIERLWNLHKHIIFDIDVRGAISIKKKYGERCLTVFVKPPSVNELIRRLKARKTESYRSLQKRIDRITRELKFEDRFDKILVNDLLDVALKEAELILESFLMISSPE